MRLTEVVWKDSFVEKLQVKHGVATEEVEQILFSGPHFRKVRRGRVRGEDVYAGYGQTLQGRFLVIFFIRKRSTVALPISAREMTGSERRYYEEST